MKTKCIETMTVYDAVNEVNEIERKMHLLHKQYIGVCAQHGSDSKRRFPYNKLMDPNSVLNNTLMEIGLDANWKEISTPDELLKRNYEDVSNYIDRLYNLKKAIKKFNDSHYIIMEAKKITISEALMYMDKLEMERKFYKVCLEQYEFIDRHRSKFNDLTRSYNREAKILNPNNIAPHYQLKVDDLDKKIRKIQSKIDKKWVNNTIVIE